MNMTKTLLAAVIALGVTSAANAADQGHGKVTFTGSIIDAPCSIVPESLDQTVELGAISNVALKDSGKSTPRNFEIKLENCEFGSPAEKNKVSVTFTGAASSNNADLLGITGTAQGAGVAITHGSSVVKLGQATDVQTLQNGNNTLPFSAYVQGDSATITEGDFQAVADFTLAYQ